MADFYACDHGSIVTLMPLTPAAEEWVEHNLPSDAPTFGGAIGIDPRYFPAIADGIVGDGLTLGDRP